MTQETKKQKARAYLKKHPDAPSEEVAKKFKMTKMSVAALKAWSTMRSGKSRAPKPHKVALAKNDDPLAFALPLQGRRPTKLQIATALQNLIAAGRCGFLSGRDKDINRLRVQLREVL